MNILEYCSRPPRPEQRCALEELERRWNDHDVFVIEAPTATGKTLLAQTIAAWAGSTTMLVPTNILLDQYRGDYPHVPYLYRRDMYPCTATPKRACVRRLKTAVRPDCSNCEYHLARSKALNADTSAMNYYMYLAMRNHYNMRCGTIIVDEAQNLRPMLSDMSAIKLWQHTWHWPNSLRTESDFLSWVDSKKLHRRKDIKPIVDSLLSRQPDYVLERTHEFFRGEAKPLLIAKPLTVSNYKPVLWPYTVRKIVLMSATINHKDLEELGLSRRRVAYIRTGSPIPPSSRPVLYTPVGRFSYGTQERDLGVLAEFIQQLLGRYDCKGLIHCTYSMARKLRLLLDHPRLIWHNHENKTEKYREYRRRKDNPMLVCSGMYEGLDLPNDLGRVQVVCKMPYPSRADSAIEARLQQDPEWYAWQAVRDLVQACGRICRHPKDFGVTYVVDRGFDRLWKNNPNLFPDWYKESLFMS